MAFVSTLAIACFLMLVLAAREAFRFRLLVGSNALLSTVGAIVVFLAWLAVAVVAFISLSLGAAIAVLVISLLVGVAARPIIAKASGGSGILSPESDARREFESRTVKARARLILRAEEMKEIVLKHDLAAADIELVLDRLLRQGLSFDEALSAASRPEVVDFFFERIGRADRADIATATGLVMVARAKAAQPDVK